MKLNTNRALTNSTFGEMYLLTLKFQNIIQRITKITDKLFFKCLETNRESSLKGLSLERRNE
jgi:hypothetical protein